MTSGRKSYLETGFKQPSKELRLVLVGKTGVGKSATGNTILGEQKFESKLCMSSVTGVCEKVRKTVLGRRVTLVDTPGLFDTKLSQQDVKEEILRCLAMSAPGPHAMLLVMKIDRFTEEEQRSVEIFLSIFQGEAAQHTILIFTHKDKLKEISIQKFISEQDKRIQDLVESFGRRFLAFNNEDQADHGQVASLLEMIDCMLEQNGNRHFTNQAFTKMDQALEVFQQNHLEVNRQEIEKEKKSSKEKWEVAWANFTTQMSERRQEAGEKKRRIQQSVTTLSKKMAEVEQLLKAEREKLIQLEEAENARKQREQAYRKKINTEIRQSEKNIDDRYSESARQEAEGSSSFLKNHSMLVILGGTAVMAAGVGIGAAGAVMLATAPVVAAPVAAVGGLYGTALAAVGLAAEVGPAAAAMAAEVGPAAAAIAAKAALLAAAQCSIQ